MGRACIFPQTASLIVPDQKVTADALLSAVVHGGERVPVSSGTNGGCVPADTLTLK